MTKLFKLLTVVLLVVTLQACVSMSSQQFAIKPEVFNANFAQIRQIIIEEAANNGYPQLSSEIKPSEYNNYEGKMLFMLNNGMGTDSFVAEFKRANGGIAVWVHGVGAKTNPESAAMAIEARLKKLDEQPIKTEQVAPAKQQEQKAKTKSKTKPSSASN